MARLPVWFFDLDNTLHHASWRIFAKVSDAMTAYIAAHLCISEAAADQLRASYWARYGATLSGLVRHHQIDLHHFLRTTHAFVDGEHERHWLANEAGLGRSLARLPGRKILLTNAPSAYAARVVQALGISRQFERRIAIEQMVVHGRLQPKPSRALLRALAARHGVAARDAILVEDTLENLKSARAVGWRTVHVACFTKRANGNAISRPPYVDLQVKSIAHLVQRHRLVVSDAT